MRRRFTGALLAGMLLGGGACTAARSAPPQTTLPPSPGGGSAPVPAPSGDRVRGPDIVLTADLSGPVARWRPVALIPFGPRPDELTWEQRPEVLQVQPGAFTIGPDGSFWIVDTGKRRIAHYSPQGRYLDDVQGPFGVATSDVFFSGGDLYVVAQYQIGHVLRFHDGRLVSGSVLRYDGRNVYAYHLLPTESGVVGQISGYTDDPGRGPVGLYTVDLPGTARLSAVPGIPIGPEAWWRLDPVGDRTFDWHTVTPDQDAVRSITVEVLDHGTSVEAAVGPGEYLVSGRDVYAYVKMAGPAPGGDGGVGGRFLLRLGPSPMLWERLPDPTRADDVVYQHIAVGPDGAVYLMVLDRKGARIYRR